MDVENLLVVPPSEATVNDIAEALARYRAAAPVMAGDLALVGCQRPIGLAVANSWPSARQVWGYGLDGADRALVDDVDVRAAPNRFDVVVIGSGDHYFVPLVRRLRLVGLRVGVVAWPWKLAGELRRTTSFVRHLDISQPQEAA